MPGDASEAFLTDEEHLWIHDAQQGDREAFARLVERYWDRLYRWLYHLTHDPHQAEDITQETFLKAFHHLSTFRPGSHFRAWLYRIAHNNFVNHRRGRHGTTYALPADVMTKADGPVEETLSREAMLHLARAVARLPNDFRSAFLLRAEEDLSFRQIADIMGITEQTARWRVFKARQKLLETLEPDLFPAEFQKSPPASQEADQ